ncbi:hypothetical protein SEPCBS119000_006251 [Sporothrix epigloea]|uniref:F-box domain-containing protein n=1 Tax=Sporothrix epigloea TaxID=1892477 RepID=A0ABP0E399_9PEZI
MAVVHADQSLAPGQDCLSRLPVELLLRVTRHLKTTDLCAVRQCSRTLESALHHFFLQEFFQRKQFMLTEYSLQTLLDMARHPVISQTLRRVSIGLEEYCVVNQEYPEDEQQAAFLIRAVVEQHAIMTNGRAMRLLAAAFSLLPNLETVQLRDYDSPTRFRDGPHEAWQSYGVQRSRSQLGENARLVFRKTFCPHFSTRAFVIMMTALAQANVRPPKLEVLIKTRLNGLGCAAFDLIPAPRLSLPGGGAAGKDDGEDDVYVVDVLAGLRRLHLKLQFNLDFYGTDNHVAFNAPYDGESKRQVTAERLPLNAWLAHCPNVEWFRLNLEELADDYNNIFLSQLGLALPAHYPLPPGSAASRDITLPFASHLRRFDLGMASCYGDVLLQLLRRMPTLEHLSLWRFSMLMKASSPHGTWEHFLKALAKDPLCKQLKKMVLSQLRTVTFHYTYSSMQRTHIVSLNRQSSIEYTAEVGVSMASWLQKVSIRYKVDPWHASSGAESDGNAQNDDDGDVHEFESDDGHQVSEEDEDYWG